MNVGTHLSKRPCDACQHACGVCNAVPVRFYMTHEVSPTGNCSAPCVCFCEPLALRNIGFLMCVCILVVKCTTKKSTEKLSIGFVLLVSGWDSVCVGPAHGQAAGQASSPTLVSRSQVQLRGNRPIDIYRVRPCKYFIFESVNTFAAANFMFLGSIS